MYGSPWIPSILVTREAIRQWFSLVAASLLKHAWRHQMETFSALLAHKPYTVLYFLQRMRREVQNSSMVMIMIMIIIINISIMIMIMFMIIIIVVYHFCSCSCCYHSDYHYFHYCYHMLFMNTYIISLALYLFIHSFIHLSNYWSIHSFIHSFSNVIYDSWQYLRVVNKLILSTNPTQLHI